MPTAAAILLHVAFWFSVFAVFHSYVLYPLLLKWLARKRKPNREVFSADHSPAEWPYLVAVLAVHNEEAVLEATLTSVFQADYPQDRFELLIAADNCTDRSVEIIERFQSKHPNLRLRVFSGRNGKIRAINRMIGENRVRLAQQGDYAFLMFDANVRWAQDLPWQLAKHFRNLKIGQVGANVIDARIEHSGIAGEEASYIDREIRIKHHEGIVWGRMMGAFGACYAMRGRLFEPVPERFPEDFFHTLRGFELGYHAILEPDARAFEDVSGDIREEFRRKRRIAGANLRSLEHFWRFLLPWRGGLATSFAFWSHKGLRWFGPFFLGGALLASACLAGQNLFYAIAFGLQIAAAIAAGVDGLLARKGHSVRLLRFVRYFIVMNFALLLGAMRFVSGVDSSIWEPTRRMIPTPGESEPDASDDENPLHPAAVPHSQPMMAASK